MIDILEHWGGVEVSAMDVYSSMFSLGYGEIQCDGEPPGDFKGNPLGYMRRSGAGKGTYRIMFDDTFEETLQELQDADFAILNGITYFGRKNTQEHATRMYAMIFDLDGVNLNSFLSGAIMAEAYPIPNYVALSGHGVHLYYLLEYGVPLYPNIKLQLKELKYALIRKMWNMYTSSIEKPQFQGINQGFRVIGGKTKIPGVRVRAWKLNEHPFSLEALGRFVPEEHRIDESKLFKETSLTLDQAKKLYPEWYQRRIVEKSEPGVWQVKRDLYDWWIRKIHEGATFGHRYFAIMALAIYGAKCGIEIEEVREDAYGLIPYLNKLHPEEPFTVADVESALECCDSRYCRFPRSDIEKLTAIAIPPNKRNGRKREQHMKVMRAIQSIDYPDGEWRNLKGRPTVRDIVTEWRWCFPNGSKAECVRDTGLDKKTVYKWWESV